MSKEHRYKLTDYQWERLAPHLSGKNGDIGRPCDDNRRFINGVLWVTRSGAPAIVTMACDLPERYGKWGTIFQRYNRWSKAGRWEQIFVLIAKEEGIDLDWAAGDSTFIRAHQHAAGQKKESYGTPSPDDCLGRSRGGFSTKLHGMSDALENPARFLLTLGQDADITYAQDLVGDYRPDAFIGDKGYDADHVVEWLK